MRRYFSISIMFLAIVLLSGCQSKVLQMVFEPQELYNYAVTEGVTCTSPGDDRWRCKDERIR